MNWCASIDLADYINQRTAATVLEIGEYDFAPMAAVHWKRWGIGGFGGPYIDKQTGGERWLLGVMVGPFSVVVAWHRREFWDLNWPDEQL